MSGLNQRFTKPPFLNWNREFESRSFRRMMIFFLVLTSAIALIYIASLYRMINFGCDNISETINSGVVDVLKILIPIIGILWGFEEYKSKELYSLKLETFMQALEIVDSKILTMNLGFDNKTYVGQFCKTEPPTDLDINRSLGKLALLSDDKNIPQLYLSIVFSTTTPGPVPLRSNLITKMRMELDVSGEIDWGILNNGDSFSLPLGCIISDKE